MLNKIANELSYDTFNDLYNTFPKSTNEKSGSYVIMLPLINVLKNESDPVNYNYYGPFDSILAHNYYDKNTTPDIVRQKLWNYYGGDLITSSALYNIQFNYENSIEPGLKAYVNIDMWGSLVNNSWFFNNTKYYELVCYQEIGPNQLNVILIGPYSA